VRINLRDLSFEPNLRSGYAADQSWEADLRRVGDAISACDHLVVGFPLWWGAEPALVKGLVDRVLLPGFAFNYRRESVWWDRLLAGRSADVIATMDTPPWFLRLVYGDPVMRRWRSQILGFCGVKPIRQYRFGPTRRGEARNRVAKWERELVRAAATVGGLRRGKKMNLTRDHESFQKAADNRMS
jgi:NAD(P)H dehydrogenase (quinone)